VEISTIAHATDNLDKVQAALRFVLPEPLKDQPLFTRRYLEGHHGNPIVTFDGKLTRPTEVDAFVREFINRLSRTEKLLIERNLESRSDEDGNLYIRIDKQQAFRRILELGEDDPIRIKMKFSRLQGDVRDLMKKVLESE
jgi:RNA binding exosome subunit